jgi:cell division protein FtsI (penicillin-binding protein 3)
MAEIQNCHDFPVFPRFIYRIDIPCFSTAGFIRSEAEKIGNKTTYHGVSVPERGIIYDRNGEKLAISIMADSVCADPSKIIDPAGTSKQIAEILNLDSQAVFKKISAPKSFCWLARKISPEQSASVENANIEGIFLVKEPKRFYPNGELAAHLLGFVGLDASGLEGLESKFDESLRGKSEKLAW